MEIAKSRIDWANLVDYFYSFSSGTYSRTNTKNVKSVFKPYNDF